MKNPKSISYLALVLAVFVMAGCLVTSLGEVNARYVTVAGSQMELKQQPYKVVLSSDVLGNGNKVVLDDLYVYEEREVEIQIFVENGTASGMLFCTTDGAYLTAKCSERQENFTQAEFVITLTPTEKADALTNPVTTTVKVVWDDILWSELEVTLLPYLTETQPLEEDEVIDGEETGDQANGEESDPTQGSEETLATEPSVEDLPDEVEFVSGMTQFDPKELLVLQITVPTMCDRLELGLDSWDFPALTRYSTDSGETFKTLYDSVPMVIEPGDARVMTLVLDLEQAELPQTEVTVHAQAYYGDISRGVATHDVKADVVLPELGIQEQVVVVRENVALSAVFPQDFCGSTVSTNLVRLDGTTDRMPSMVAEDNRVTIRSTNNGVQARAGAYVLEVDWVYENVTIASRQMKFYVNYTDYLQSTLPSEDQDE